MLKRLIKIFLNRSSNLERNRKFMEEGKNCDISGLNLKLTTPAMHKKFIKVGNDSVVKGDFIFSKDSGFITVGHNSFIGGSTFICIDSIEIGNDVMISWGCTFVDNNAHAIDWKYRKNDVADWKRGLDEGKTGIYKDWTHVDSKKVIIKDKAWIGFNSIILKGVTIGEGAVVGAGSVVTKDIPDWVVVAGNPAKIIKHINPYLE